MPEKKYPSLPRFEPKSLDHSAFKLFKECHRKYFYRIILGRKLEKSAYQSVFDFGTAYHKFCEVLERKFQAGSSQKEALALAMAETLALPLTPGEGKYEFYNKKRLYETCMVKFEDWQREKEKGAIEVIAIEQPFNLMMPDGKYISGRADQIIRWQGYIWGRDFKTTSKIQQYFDATLDPNDQPTRYIYAESRLHYGDSAIEKGKLIKGIVFEVMQNNKTTSPKMYRTLVTKTTTQMKMWEAEQMWLHKMLDMCMESDVWAMHESNCSFCDYKKVCRAPNDSNAENTLRNEFVLSPWDHEKVIQTVISE